MNFGSRLRMAREHKGYTQTEVSKITGLNNKSLSHYENDVSSPDLKTIVILAELYDVSTDYLFGIINKFKHVETNPIYEDPENQNLLNAYHCAEDFIQIAVKKMLDISLDDVKKENLV